MERVRRVPSKPAAVPSDMRHLIQLSTKYRVLICPNPRCQKAVQPHAFTEHLRVQHQIGLGERRRVEEYIDGFEWDYNHTTVPIPKDESRPQAGLSIQDGYQCRQCRFKSVSRKKMKIHGNEEHKQMRVADEELFQNIRMQTWFQDSRQRYWAVKEDGIYGQDPNVCRRCRDIIGSSSDGEGEEIEQRSQDKRSGRGQAPGSEVVIAGSARAGTTREVIRIDESKGEVIDAMVGNGASEVDTEGEGWEDEYEDVETDTGTDDDWVSANTGPPTVARRPGSVVVRQGKQDDKCTGHVVQDSGTEDTDDSDACLVPMPQGRKRKHTAGAPERAQRRRITDRIADSGIGMGSDIPSEWCKTANASKEMGSSSIGRRNAISIASSQVSNMPSSPPVLEAASETIVDSQTVAVPSGDGRSGEERFAIQWASRVALIKRRPDPWIQKRAEPWSVDRPARKLPWQTTPAIFVTNRSHVRPGVVSFPEVARLMDWWNQGCQLCHLRKGTSIQHRIEQCTRREARTIAEVARDMYMETPRHELDCIHCQGPARICRQRHSPERCMYPEAGWAIAMATMLQEGDDGATEELYKYMSELGVDITDKKSVHEWFGGRVPNGEVEVSRLAWVFYQLAMVNEKRIDRGSFRTW